MKPNPPPPPPDPTAAPDLSELPTVSEAAFQANLLLGFSKIPNTRVWRQGVGAFRVGDESGGRVVAFGLPGMADISGISERGFRIEVEVKAAAGRVRPEQTKWAEFIQRMGGIYMLAQYDDTLDMKANVALCVERLRTQIADKHGSISGLG